MRSLLNRENNLISTKTNCRHLRFVDKKHSLTSIIVYEKDILLSTYIFSG